MPQQGEACSLRESAGCLILHLDHFPGRHLASLISEASFHAAIGIPWPQGQQLVGLKIRPSHSLYSSHLDLPKLILRADIQGS